MSVSVGDQHGEGEAACELLESPNIAASVDERGHRLVVAEIFLVGIDPADLREVLDVDRSPLIVSIEAAYGVGEGLLPRPYACWKGVQLVTVVEPDLWDLDADRGGQRHHRVLVARHIAVGAVGELDDPVSSLAEGR